MFRPTVLLTFEVGLIYLTLVACGYWSTRLLSRWSTPFPSISAPLVGLVLLQAISWYVSSADVGLEAVWPWLPALGLLAIVPIVLFATRRSARAVFKVRHPRVLLSDVLTAVTSFILFVIHADDLLARGTLSIASANNDVAAYVAVTDHLARSGFDTAGPISGVDLGRVAEVDVNGAYSYLFSAHWVLDRPYFQLVLGCLAVASILVAQALGRLLCRWTQLPVVAVVAVAVLPQTTFLYSYISSMYFLSQLLGLAFAITMIEIATRPYEGRQGFGMSAAALAAMFAGLVLTYPHMAFLLPPIVAVVIVASHGRDWRAFLWGILRLGTGAAIGLLVMLPRTKVAIDRLLLLKDVEAGWPLDGVLPWGMVGAQERFVNTVSAVTIVGSVLVVGVSFVASAWLMHRDEDPWPRAFAVLLAACLASYAAFYFLRGGPTYEQWKWVSFVQPLIVAAIFAPVFDALARRLPYRHGVLPIGLLAIVVVVNMNRSVPYTSSVALQTNWVSFELGTLGENAAFDGVESVNIDLAPYWESMWAADALFPRPVYIQAVSYYTPSAPVGDWTLTRRQPAAGWVGSQDVRTIGASGYVLVSSPSGPTTVSLAGVSADIDAVVEPAAADSGSGGRATVTVSNRGTTTLLGSGSTAGSINIGVEIVDDSGQIVNRDFSRTPLVPAPYALDPGRAMTVTFDLPLLPAGTQHLRFDLVDEGVAWLGDIGSTDPAVVEIPGA